MRRLFFIVVACALLLDQATKIWVRIAADGVEGRSLYELWPGVFELKLVYNEGIAFGMLQGAGVLLTPIAALIAFGAAWYSLRHPDETRATHFTMALLCAGALGNLIDRIWDKRVTDMFWFRAIDFPVFNVADVCITAAGVMLGVSVLGELFHRGRQEGTGPRAEGQGPEVGAPVAPESDEDKAGV
ncbi:MAG: signal peptidase II [Fimbriimonadaceae bacterium]